MRRINQCINERLTKICQQAMNLDAFNDKLLPLLPDEMQGSVFVSSFMNGTMVLTVTDSVWASQLRFMIPDLRDRLRKEKNLYQLSSIKIIVTTPSFHDLLPEKQKPSLLSKDAKESLRQASEQFDFAPLRQAFLNLADDE